VLENVLICQRCLFLSNDENIKKCVHIFLFLPPDFSKLNVNLLLQHWITFCKVSCSIKGLSLSYTYIIVYYLLVSLGAYHNLNWHTRLARVSYTENTLAYYVTLQITTVNGFTVHISLTCSNLEFAQIVMEWNFKYFQFWKPNMSLAINLNNR
jgi:hypothetical protein